MKNGYTERPTKKRRKIKEKIYANSSRLLQSLFPLQIMKRKFCRKGSFAEKESLVGDGKEDRQNSLFTHFLFATKKAPYLKLQKPIACSSSKSSM